MNVLSLNSLIQQNIYDIIICIIFVWIIFVLYLSFYWLHLRLYLYGLYLYGFDILYIILYIIWNMIDLIHLFIWYNWWIWYIDSFNLFDRFDLLKHSFLKNIPQIFLCRSLSLWFQKPFAFVKERSFYYASILHRIYQN